MKSFNEQTILTQLTTSHQSNNQNVSPTLPDDKSTTRQSSSPESYRLTGVPFWSYSPRKKRRRNMTEEKAQVQQKAAEAIFSWDIDDTLIDSEGNLLFPERVKALLKKIKANGFINVIVTARYYSAQSVYTGNEPKAVQSVRKRLGEELFDGTYYSNGALKLPIVDQISEDYMLDTTTQLCHTDDNKEQLDPITDAGYVTAYVNREQPDSDAHLDTVEKHLDFMIYLKNLTEEELEENRANKRARML